MKWINKISNKSIQGDATTLLRLGFSTLLVSMLFGLKKIKIRHHVIILLAFLIYCTESSSKNVEECRRDYSTKKDEIQLHLKNMKLKYDTSGNEEQKKILEQCSKKIFDYLTEDIFPAWYGTKWSFNGNSKTPGEGNIACGYFVIYTLQDVGFKISSKMALQPSENIIKNLIDPESIKRFTDKTDMTEVKNWIRSQGEGLFIVGLDIHVGFIIYKENRMTFCHSSYYNPPLKVENEDINHSSPLTDSKYRVIAKILNDEMMRKWINGEEFEMTYDYFKNDN